jgi:hypothetical protein
MAAKKGTAKKYGKAATRKIQKVMHEWKEGSLHSGRSGPKVTSQKQAVAIALSEAREAGAKVPKKAPATRKRKAA